MPSFSGLPKDFFPFFTALKQHNNRDWFNDNKARYRESVVEPLLGFIETMAPILNRISPHYRAVAKANGGSLFRIYRDTRFSADKTPYKTHAAVQFRHAAGKDAHAPGFYAHFETDGLFFGGGIWRPPGPHLGRIREAIVDNPSAWARITNTESLKACGGIRGDSLKRPPRGFDPEHRHIGDLKRKSFYVMSEAPAALARQPDLVENVSAAFRTAAPLNRFVCQALGLPF